MLYCQECGSPLKPNATHCLECGQSIPLGPAAPPTINAANLPPITYAEPQPAGYRPAPAAAAPAANPMAYASTGATTVEPSLLERWLRDLQGGSAKFSIVGILVRLVYFFTVGIWLSQIWIVFAWLISMTLIGLPLTYAMVRVLPQIAFLSPFNIPSDASLAHNSSLPDVSIGVRIIYFVLVGWWMSLVWLEFAWIAGITIIGLPVAYEMVRLLPTVTTLARR